MSRPTHKHHHTPDTKSERQVDGQDWSQQPMPASCAPESELKWPKESPSQESEEQALVESMQKGERPAIKALYRQFAPTLLRRILRLLGGDMNQAEDCLQQVFYKAIKSIHLYRGDNTLHAWLNRITTHAVMDIFRAHQSQHKMVDRLSALLTVRHSGNGNRAIPEKLFLQKELQAIVHRGLETMERHKRMAVLLCDWEGYSIEEAAIELDIPIGTLASRLYRGRQELQKWLKRELTQSGISAEEWLHE